MYMFIFKNYLCLKKLHVFGDMLYYIIGSPLSVSRADNWLISLPVEPGPRVLRCQGRGGDPRCHGDTLLAATIPVHTVPPRPHWRLYRGPTSTPWVSLSDALSFLFNFVWAFYSILFELFIQFCLSFLFNFVWAFYSILFELFIQFCLSFLFNFVCINLNWCLEF